MIPYGQTKETKRGTKFHNRIKHFFRQNPVFHWPPLHSGRHDGSAKLGKKPNSLLSCEFVEVDLHSLATSQGQPCLNKNRNCNKYKACTNRLPA